MATSDLIARFIMDTLDKYNGIAELQRSALADMFGCVPSQINYVISTRFSPEHGYAVESRRGGGGYIRISRVRVQPDELIMRTINAAGERLDMATAAAYLQNAASSGARKTASARLILAAIGDNSLRPVPRELRDEVRASIFKQLLIQTISSVK